MNKPCRSALAGFIASLAVALCGAALAADKGGGHEGHDMGGDGGGMMGMMHMPGHTMPMCGDMMGMPHYCEPSYMVASSVLGVKIVDVMPMGAKTLMFTLKTYGPLTGRATPKLAVVGGGKGLAGATTVDAGWKDGATVHLELEGSGDVYGSPSLHLHAFPLTGR